MPQTVCAVRTRRVLNYSIALIAAAAVSLSPVAAQRPTGIQRNAVTAAPLSPVQSYQKQKNGIVCRLREGTLHVEVFGPRTVRVWYARDSVAPPRSLSVVQSARTTPWRLITDANALSVETSALKVRISRQTGAVRFLSPQGKTLLAEADSGRGLASPSPDKALVATQQFALPPDEDFYGLGQHQQGAMSYRGETVTLQQENREIGIPFLVSSRGYGLLWDNPAVTRVNLGGGDAQPIPASQLYSETGKPGALTARYYQGMNFETLVATRDEAGIDFNWTQQPPEAMPHDEYSVRWSGSFQTGKAGEYTFVTTSDDGVRLWIDDKLVIDNWAARAVETNRARVALGANSRHRIRLEYFQNRYDAIIRLGWVPPTTEETFSISSEAADAIDYYFVYGPSLDTMMASYRELTGKAPLPPRWALGLWQSKERYVSQAELLDIVGEYRRRKMPLDVIVQDWQYWTPHPWGSHVFNAERFPDPDKMMRDLHAQNAHLLISVWPKFDVGSENAKELAKVNGLYPQVIPYVFPPGNGQWYDPFNPAARKVYWDQINRQLFSHGIDGFWLDGSEAELSGNWGEFRNFTTFLGSGARVYNAYPLEHTRAVYEGQRAATDKKRVMTLTRSAYAGQQRYGVASWSGDIGADWTVFAHQIPAGLNFSLSGIPYWTTDIGGFFIPGNFAGGSGNPAYGELFTRWFQYGAFCPLFRVHGTDTSKELWRFGPKYEPILVRYDNLRYRLLPYLYAQAWQTTSAGASLMRALVMDFPDDQTARQQKDAFLFGPSLLVCPVIQSGATTRQVYLPRSSQTSAWVDFWTGKRYAGGQTITANAPLDTLPLYVKSGAVIPMGPVRQYTGEVPDAPIELRLYPGADGTFTLYEDAGDGYAYEKGEYATIPLHWDDKRHVLTIGAREGKFPGLARERTFNIVWVRPEQGTGGDAVTTPDVTVRYTGKAMTVKEPSH